jgi:hypothetical protein
MWPAGLLPGECRAWVIDHPGVLISRSSGLRGVLLRDRITPWASIASAPRSRPVCSRRPMSPVRAYASPGAASGVVDVSHDLSRVSRSARNSTSLGTRSAAFRTRCGHSAGVGGLIRRLGQAGGGKKLESFRRAAHAGALGGNAKTVREQALCVAAGELVLSGTWQRHATGNVPNRPPGTKRGDAATLSSQRNRLSAIERTFSRSSGCETGRPDPLRDPPGLVEP